VASHPPVLLVGASGSAHPGRRRESLRRGVASGLPKVALRDVRSQGTSGCAFSGAVSLFLKVTKSYWKGLFHCYRFPDLPRTNNDLEHCFGSARYHERRASGRRNASPAMVVRGSVRVVAAVATPPEGLTATDIRPADVERWRTLRASLEKRRESRRAQLRFRRNPDAYLSRLEEQLLKQALPS
jgi:hypothetical protein